jgi:hypothetical protein
MKRTLIALLVGMLACVSVATAAQGKKPPSGTTICHATGSAKTPYVKLKLNKTQLKAHVRHSRDIIPAPATGCPKEALSPTKGGTELKATLAGANEVPGPGDPDGTGNASIRLMSGLGVICFTLNVDKIVLPASAAHIHVGAAGVAGNVVVPLKAPTATAPNATTGSATGCTNVARTLVSQILANPAGYYVNVHTTDYPNGAVRGQLSV